MLKMVIRMNDDKITAENKYRLDGIYNTINHTFQTVGLPRMEDGSGALVFRDCGRARDFSLFGRIVNTLKRQTWFMDNVSVWRLYDRRDEFCRRGDSSGTLAERTYGDCHRAPRVLKTRHDP